MLSTLVPGLRHCIQPSYRTLVSGHMEELLSSRSGLL